MVITSIFDYSRDRFLGLQLAETEADARRSFRNSVLASKDDVLSVLWCNADDFTLFCLGAFDEHVGEFVILDEFKVISSAKQIKEDYLYSSESEDLDG